MNPKSLFEPYRLGKLELSNRVVMAPMTRSRAIGNIPNEAMARYYSQRASAGLIVTEGVAPSVNGLGYARIPGLFSSEQIEGWRKITQSVHDRGGRIFAQLMHTGRVSHSANMPPGTRIVAPSAIAMSGKMWTDEGGHQPYPAPEEMSLEDIRLAIDEFAQAAQNAIHAGIDGVELHGANGYLIDQFLNPTSNQRTDGYGGSNENRMRFAIEVAAAVALKIGPDKVGIRLSPYGVFNDMKPYEGIDGFFATLAKELSDLGLAYLHLVDHSAMGAPQVSQEIKRLVRERFKGTLILSGGYDADRAQVDLDEGRGDLVAFGRPFISNPTLVEKLRVGAPLATADHTTFYSPGEKGYTDYL